MTQNPLIDHIQTGSGTYDLLSREVKNSNSSSVQPKVLLWLGTQAQYDALPERDPATVYSITDLSPSQAVYDAVLTIQRNGTTVETFSANASSAKTANIIVPTQASDVGALPDSTKYGASVDLSINSSTYVVTLQLKDQDGNNMGTAKTIDLPLESVVVGGRYDSTTKSVVLTLQNGQTITFSVADLVSGLQSEITSSNKLSADLVDDTSTTHKFVTASDKTTWSGKQDALVSGTNIKTINNNSLLGSGNITIDSLPSQTGNTGKFLTTDGSDASWATVPSANNPTITITQGGVTKGSFTLNQATGDTIALDAGGSSVVLDNKSITENSSNQLQTVGVINQANTTTAVKTWTGTLQQYNAITTKDSNTLYNITDDTTEVTYANVNLNNLSSAGQALFNAKASTNLDNLTSTGKNIANWSSNITNCITYIPQDIKLELNNGTLTLKAGSKVYIPNGFEQDGTTPNFKEKVLQADVTVAFGGSTTGTYMITIQDKDFDACDYIEISHTYSGTNNPAATYSYWYDTGTNLNKLFIESTTTPARNESLPIAIMTVVNSAVTSVDKVFNGFGYIGSTVFALPGVKGLIPNGRNDDGTLKSNEMVLSSVLTFTQPVSGWNGRWSLYLKNNTIDCHPTQLEYISNEKPSLITTTTAYWYSPLNNKLYYTIDMGFSWEQVLSLHCVDMTESSTKITSLTPKTVFHALDYNDKSTISGWGMPSNRYTDLTLGASGTTYTAPANGYFSLYGTVTAGNGYTDMTCKMKAGGQNATNTGSVWGWLPVAKGENMTVSYAYFTSAQFRFIYAEGEV